MLEIDFTPFFDCEIILNSITLTISEAVVEDLTGQAGLSLPLSCVSHDHITFIYRIAPVDTDVASQSLVRDLNIAISATALVDAHTKPCLRMTWTAVVDFTVPVNPGYRPTMQPIHARTDQASYPLGVRALHHLQHRLLRDLMLYLLSKHQRHRQKQQYRNSELQ